MSTVTFGRLRAAAKRIQHDALTVYFVARDPNTPSRSAACARNRSVRHESN